MTSPEHKLSLLPFHPGTDVSAVTAEQYMSACHPEDRKRAFEYAERGKDFLAIMSDILQAFNQHELHGRGVLDLDSLHDPVFLFSKPKQHEDGLIYPPVDTFMRTTVQWFDQVEPNAPEDACTIALATLNDEFFAYMGVVPSNRLNPEEHSFTIPQLVDVIKFQKKDILAAGRIPETPTSLDPFIRKQYYAAIGGRIRRNYELYKNPPEVSPKNSGFAA